MEQPQASPMYKPCLQQQETTPGLGCSDSTVEDPMTTDQCHDTRDLEDSQLVGVPVTLARDVDMAERDDGCCLPNLKAQMEVTVVGKRKRGRPARALPKTPPPLRKKRDEEDVCFICFDGGSLVLCDRRGCPKAYHPACIKRDESFFRSKAKWNCGWHICSICRKASHYMCYTCTFSLCKGCTKDADFVCVRGNKGLCGMCMRTIMLIENSAQGNKAMCEVDFDDKSSWEYLFKVYWIYLKGKLSLTLDELIQAKNPWKGTVPMTCKAEVPHELHLKDDKGSGSENSCIDIESNNLKNTNYSRQPELPNKEDCFDRTTSGGDNSVSLPECTKWVSKELQEFVAHMKNGDTSLLSQFDVQALLLEYVKKNNLRDPQQKCQIVCDSRLLNLFGKARVGHLEMLKLLESHFLIKDNGPPEKTFGAGVIDPVVNVGEASDHYDSQLMLVKEKRRKTFRKDDVQVPQNNPDAYAAINSHNINLIYLRRSLMENLTEDAEKIHKKVVGSFVRIRISSSEQKHEMHRLVEVVGTSKVAEPYKIGTRTTDIVLEILNLNRKEVILIDEISNQEFSEDECKHLRQSMKYGLSKRLTVGEILDKALSLQEMRVNDLLEAEILRLSHLRDRASEKGHKKELRECVEKLQILSSPEERQRRLHEIPEVHSDPNLDLMFESDEDAGDSDERKPDDNVGSKYSGVDRRERGLIFPKGWDGVLNDVGRRTQDLPTTRETIGNTFIEKNQINPNNAAVNDSTNVGVVRSEVSDVAIDISSLFLSTVMEQSCDFVNDKLWHYRDPAGKIQGPFSMLLLYKWNACGHFPSDLRIWRINEKEDDSILLTDILSRKCSNMSLGQAVENKPPASSNVPVQEVVPSWSTASSLVNGGTPLPEVTVEWRRCSPEAPPNPSVEEWDSNVVSASSLRPVETIGDCATTPSSISCQLTHSSPSHPACNTSTWQAIIGEANDLVDESVSDLLAEVEAMESLGGLESPTSIMNCGEELTEGSKTDCLSSAEGLSPMLDAGKGDALSSTGDLHLPSHSSAAEEPLRQADVSRRHHQRTCGEHSSRSSEVEVGTKRSSVSGNQWESCSEDPPMVSSSGTWDMSTDTTWRLGSGTTSDWQSSQVNANLGWDGMYQRTSNMGWGLGRTTMQENRSTNSDTSAGTPGFAGSQTRYVSDRFSLPRDRGFHGHGRESGFGRGRTVWNRQPSFGVGNGGLYRPLPKGQRVCKFYESGYCKKGAYCDYLHP